VVLLTVIATPAFAQSFDPDNGTGNVLAFSQNAPENEKTAVRHSGLHSSPWFHHASRRACHRSITAGALPNIHSVRATTFPIRIGHMAIQITCSAWRAH